MRLGAFGRKNPDPRRVYAALLKRIEPKANCAPAEVEMALRKMATLEERHGKEYLLGRAPPKEAPRQKSQETAREAAERKARQDRSRAEARRQARRKAAEAERERQRREQEEKARRREEARQYEAERVWERTEGRRLQRRSLAAERRRRQDASRRWGKTRPVMSWTEFWRHRCNEWEALKREPSEMRRQMKALREGLKAHPARSAGPGEGWHFRLPDPFGHYPFKRRILCGFAPLSTNLPGDVRGYVISQLGLDPFIPVDVWPAGTDEPPLVFTQQNPITVLTGTMGAGKTTLAKEKAGDFDLVIHTDTPRVDSEGRFILQPNKKARERLRQEKRQQIRDAHRAGKRVLVEGFPRGLTRFPEAVEAAEELWILDTPEDVALASVEQRSRERGSDVEQDRADALHERASDARYIQEIQQLARGAKVSRKMRSTRGAVPNPLLKPKKTFGIAYEEWGLNDYPLQLVIADMTDPHTPLLVAGGTIDFRGTDYESSMMAATRGYGPLLYDAAATLLDSPLGPSKDLSTAARRFWARQGGQVEPLTKAEWGYKYRTSLAEMVQRGKGISTADFLELIDEAEELAADASEGEAMGMPVRTPWEDEMAWKKAEKTRKPRLARKPKRTQSNPLNPDFPPIREYRDKDVYDPRDEAIRAVVRGADRSGAAVPWGIARGRYLREHSVGETIERSYERYQDVDRLIRGRQEYEVMLGRGRKYGPFRATLEPTRQGLRFFVWPLTRKSHFLPVSFSTQGAADSYIRELYNEGFDPTRDLGTIRAKEYSKADLRDWLPPESAFLGRSGNPTRVKIREEKKIRTKLPPPPPTPKQRKPKKIREEKVIAGKTLTDWDKFFSGGE